jgi:hypothetical protein
VAVCIVYDASCKYIWRVKESGILRCRLNACLWLVVRCDPHLTAQNASTAAPLDEGGAI